MSIGETAYDHPKYYVTEVSPPGWGHTKAEKEKTKPWKPKSKIGGSAAQFNKDLESGKFKGLPGDKTKKDRRASMFKIMWAAKKKGYKPHYKPGTDEKYKKYQDKDNTNEETTMRDNNLFGDAYATLKKKVSSKKKPDKPAVEEGIMQMVKRAVKKKEKKPELPTGAEKKIRRWRDEFKDREHKKYVNDFRHDDTLTGPSRNEEVDLDKRISFKDFRSISD